MLYILLFYGTEIEIWAGFGPVVIIEKNWADYEQLLRALKLHKIKAKRNLKKKCRNNFYSIFYLKMLFCEIEIETGNFCFQYYYHS